MRNIVYLTSSLIVLLFVKAHAQNSQFTIQGTIIEAPVSIIYLQYVDYSGKEVLDSTQIQRETFTFKGRINQPTRATLKTTRQFMADEENLNRATIFLEPKNLKLQVVYNQFKAIKVDGSKTQNEFHLLTAQQAPFVKRYMALRDSLTKLRQRKLVSPVEYADNHQLQSAITQLWSTSYQFIQDHPSSWVSAYELSLFKSTWPIDSVRYLFNRLTPAIRRGRVGQEIAHKIDLIDRAKSSIGAPAPAFSSPDLTGQLIKLSDFKGRYVLLDFWGSWCVPCRAGNPHLLELYRQYRAKGIEFIGVACEDKQASWRKAVAKDGIGIWKHILDTELVHNKVIGQEKSLTKAYWIDSFPTKILIDPQGIIIGRYKGNDEAILDKKIAELLN